MAQHDPLAVFDRQCGLSERRCALQAASEPTKIPDLLTPFSCIAYEGRCMSTVYDLPSPPHPPKIKRNHVLLIASGDLRLSANQKCWPAQRDMEAALTKAV